MVTHQLQVYCRTGKVGWPENIASDPANIFYNHTLTLLWPTSRSYVFHFIIRSCFVHVQKVSDIFNLIVQEIERSQNVSVDSQKGGCIVSWIQRRCRRCRAFSCHYGYTTADEQNHRVVSIDSIETWVNSDGQSDHSVDIDSCAQATIGTPMPDSGDCTVGLSLCSCLISRFIQRTVLG